MPPPTAASALSLATEAALIESPRAPAASGKASALGIVAAGYGLAGQLALLLFAAVQLSRAALRGLATEDRGLAWALAAASVAALSYLQGYRGFQRRYSPLVAGRAAFLARSPRPWHVAAAPLYVCGLVHATRRRRRSTALLYAIMPLLALAVRRLPEPGRAAVELGVACGLLWGAIAMVVFTVRSLLGRPPATALDLPSPPSP
jgi:hypothetical protein